MLSLLAGILFSCRCVPVSDADALKSSEVAFEGIVLEEPEPAMRGKASIQVSKSLKGKAAGTIEVDSGESSCSVNFQRGARYRVYAQRAGKGPLRVNACSGTRSLP